MKAAQITAYGAPEIIRTVTDAAKPVIKTSQVLIQVHASAVNPFDLAVLSGAMRRMKELDFPAVLGSDFAGVIAEVGPEVANFKPGDAVYGQAGPLSSHGSFAEFGPASPANLGPKPASVSFEEAAALPLVGVSAYQALVETLNLQPGQKILIHGGAGGIGSLAIQLAKHLGAYVATTAEASHADFLKGLGADVVIDYKTEKFQDKLSDYDAVFDTVGGQTYTDSHAVLKPGGAIASMSAPVDEALARQHRVSAFHQYTKVTTDRLAALTKLVESGAVKPVIAKTFRSTKPAPLSATSKPATPRAR